MILHIYVNWVACFKYHVPCSLVGTACMGNALPVGLSYISYYNYVQYL